MKRKLVKKLKNKVRNIQHSIVEKGFDGPVYRAVLVLIYKLCFILNGGYQEVKAEILEHIRSNVSEERFRDKKYIRRTLNDFIYSRCNYGIRYDEYYTLGFPMLSHAGRMSFIGFSEREVFLYKVNKKSHMKYFNIKAETYGFFEKYYKRELIALNGNDDMEAFRHFVERHSDFIRKPVNDYGGHGIKIFHSEEYTDVPALFAQVMDVGPCVIEELIVQGDELAQLHPNSVNTVRVVSFRENAEKVRIAWCFLRIGMGNSNVDNMHAGGLACMVDPETGVVYSRGRDYMNHLHIFHPDTGVQLVGYQVPEWDKLMELLKEVVNVLPEVRLVGWDFAYSKDGWVLVEGNSHPGFAGAQISEFCGKMELIKSLEKSLLNTQA